jgi:hypothetical protein
MKIVKINGGLGNQMFQYAFALSLSAADPGEEVLIDSSACRAENVHNGFELERVFSAALREASDEDVDRLSIRPRGLISRARRKYFTKRSHFIDKKFGYQEAFLGRSGEIYFEGYWQSEKYFIKLEEEIRKEYSFKRPLAEMNLALLGELPRPIASVHVRRGDYLKYPNLNICTRDYYSRAIASMASRTKIGAFLVLSEDAEYCRSILDFGSMPAAFVDWNIGSESWQDMAMMSLCDHHIIANSSFSWWGAWLNGKAEKRVIAPAIWNRREVRDNDRYYSYSFADVVPSSWERVAI